MLKHEMFFEFGQLTEHGVFGIFLVVLLIIWSIAWKGAALWIAAKENHKPWFIILLFLNTFGILEIIYLLCFSKRGAAFLIRLKQGRTHKSK